jgi:hypothetical protein
MRLPNKTPSFHRLRSPPHQAPQFKQELGDSWAGDVLVAVGESEGLVNQMEREMCQYLDWELNVEPQTLSSFEELKLNVP